MAVRWLCIWRCGWAPQGGVSRPGALLVYSRQSRWWPVKLCLLRRLSTIIHMLMVSVMILRGIGRWSMLSSDTEKRRIGHDDHQWEKPKQGNLSSTRVTLVFFVSRHSETIWDNLTKLRQLSVSTNPPTTPAITSAPTRVKLTTDGSRFMQCSQS